MFNQKAIDTAKVQLVNDFELWYSDTFASGESVPADRASVSSV